jgi:hypothetical protein
MEIFGFTAQNSQFICDTGASTDNVGFDWNTVRGGQFINNVFTGPYTSYGMELAQRDSEDMVFQGNTFNTTSVGFGEYGAHWKFINNHFWLSPASPAAVALTGLDVLFDGNDVHGNQTDTTSGGWAALLTDFYGPSSYAPYLGQVRVTNNTFTCQADGNSCVLLKTQDPTFSNNRVYAKGTARGLWVTYPTTTATIQGNYLAMGSGTPMMIGQGGGNTQPLNITGNTVLGSSTSGLLLYPGN